MGFVKERPILVHVWPVLKPIQTLETLDFEADDRFQPLKKLKYSADHHSDRRTQQEYREKTGMLQALHPTSVVEQSEVFYVDGQDGQLKKDRTKRVSTTILRCFKNNGDQIADHVDYDLQQDRAVTPAWRNECLQKFGAMHPSPTQLVRAAQDSASSASTPAD